MPPSPDFWSPAERLSDKENKEERETSSLVTLPDKDANAWFAAFSTRRLKSHYSLPRRFSSTVVAFAPWIDVLLLGTAFVLFQLATALVPGQPVELPAIGFRDGTRSSLSLVVNTIPDSQIHTAPADEDAVAPIPAVAWFDDERYLLNRPHRISALRNELGAARIRTREDTLLLYLDKDLSFENALRISEIARDAGFRNVSCVSQF